MNDKVRHILGEAARQESHRRSRQAVRVALAALVVAAVGLAVLFTYLSMSPRVSEAMAQLGAAEVRAAELRDEVARLENENGRLRELHLYSEMLPIEGLRIKNSDGVLRISGQISNFGRRPVNDVELTAYMVDENGVAVHEETHTAHSHDGRPLYRYQRRRFSFEAPRVPGAEDVHIVITGIDFE